MTEKRFTIDKDYGSDGNYEYCFVDNETGRVFNWAEDWIFDDFLKLVNTIISNQIKENEQLKKENQRVFDLINTIIEDLKKTNEVSLFPKDPIMVLERLKEELIWND